MYVIVWIKPNEKGNNMANNSEGRRKLAESFVDNNGVSRDFQDIDKYKAEQVWDYCKKELKDNTIAIKDLDSDLYPSTTSRNNGVEFDSNLSVERIIQNAISDLPPKMKKTILDCLREKNFPLQVLKDEQETLPIKHQTVFSFWTSIPRRYLRRKSGKHRHNNNNNNQKYIIAAAVASVVAVLALMALFLFVCLKKKKRVEPKDGQRDEKPLLNFSASDISAGSSSLGNPSSKDFKAPSNAHGPLDANCDSSQAVSNSTEAHAEAVGKTATLPLPPGRTAPPPPPPGPPPPPPKPPAPAAPPPPPKIGRRPPNPPVPAKPSLLGPHHRRSSTGEASDVSDESEAPKTKLKPFFWDKVLASPDHSMVWHEIKAGSFQFNEEMMETLFGYAPADKNKNEHRKDSPSFESPPQFIQIIDPKKSQNLAILLKALNVTTEEVCDALNEGNELPAELVQTLLRMAPTTDEELKLRLYGGDVSHLGPAERFLKVACKELRNSRLFLKLLEAVLKTGNRMNDGTYRGGAQAFKLETLLKLSDVKGTDGKTTLLHFVVQEIIRSEGIRAARRLRESRSMSSVKTEDLVEDASNESEEYHRTLGLQVVSGLSSELQNVKKAAIIDNESVSESVSKLGQALVKTKAFLDTEMKGIEGESEFRNALTSFVEQCESDIKWMKDEEKRIMALTPRKEASASSSSPTSKESPSESSLDIHRRLFPAMRERQMDDDFSSDDET
ncbi:hypothetical protein DH2020_022824 [Rehmannia glutinosa]|uniref:Formin-like protein n=1 Tax=Rehmannia glutinosa TaxID=99300 RepID=A0ABR0W4A2_REHGL